MADKELYADCDIEVKRQIWMANNKLFGEEVTPILTAYAEEKGRFTWKLLQHCLFGRGLAGQTR